MQSSCRRQQLRPRFMKKQLSNILDEVSYEDLLEALEAKKKDQIADLKEQRASLENQVRSLRSEIGELDRKIADLGGGRRGKQAKRRDSTLSGAILSVLSESPEEGLSAADVAEAVRAFGHGDDPRRTRRSVSVYLHRMTKAGALRRVSRGRYAAV